jgi:hypothetical protein
MKTLFYAATAAVVALTTSVAANAATFVSVNEIEIFDSVWSDNFGATVKIADAGDTFTKTFVFDTTGYGDLKADLSIISGVTVTGAKGDINFTSVKLDTYVFDLTQDLFNPITNKYEDIASLGAVSLLEGVHTLTVIGFSKAPASFAGTINVSPIPEPATWALMLAGVAAVGTAMRRRSQTVRVSFS